jgi:hypothetical protein
METRGTIQVRLKSKSFLLLVPEADKPLERDGAGLQTDGHAGVVDAAVATAFGRTAATDRVAPAGTPKEIVERLASLLIQDPTPGCSRC